MEKGLSPFLARAPALVHISLSRVRGSAPRDSGTEMFVSADDFHGTIGGGYLEYTALQRAREMLANGTDQAEMDIALGPENGQCCGGRIGVSLRRLTAEQRSAFIARNDEMLKSYPSVLIFGAGHVGRALADMLALLPLQVALIDSRAEELARCTSEVDKRLSPLPEAEVRAASPGSAFVVLTHDHGLDFLLTAEALARGDTAYVGMIGSTSKRAAFAGWCRREMPELSTDALICPIGAEPSRDKRPPVIAAFVTAEIMSALARGGSEQGME